MNAASDILIVGASAAGIAAAVGLRDFSFDGTITVLGDEPHTPYERPPLSKGVTEGGLNLHDLALHEAGQYERLGIDVRLGVRAASLDIDSRVVNTEEHGTFSFENAVIATGVRARRLPYEISGVHYLRTFDDAVRYTERLQAGSNLLIVGAGFIGLEAASAATDLGCVVQIVEPNPAPLSNVLGADLASLVLQKHEARGVQFHLGTAVEAIARRNDELYVTLRGGEELVADIILVGIGTIPNTEWLQDSGLDLDNGVLCDEYLRAADGIYAAGDIANLYDVHSASHLRIEHRLNASQQGLAAARIISGDTLPYTEIPSFWSEQLDVRLQMYGRRKPDSVMEIVEGDLGGERFVARYTSDGEVDAVFGWNAAKLLVPHRNNLVATRRELIEKLVSTS